MANLNFKKDLLLGNEGEDILIEFLKHKGCKPISKNDDKKYDLKMVKKGVETTYEIKTDFKCAPLFDTGNIFIEFESRGTKSGIMVTEADWFVTYFKYLNEIWFIKSKKLITLINDNNFPVFLDAGDLNSNTKGYLINRKKYKKYFNVYKI
jgi:hypothetical protein